MSGSVIAFSDIFDTAIAVSEELEIFLDKPVSVEMLTDNKSFAPLYL